MIPVRMMLLAGLLLSGWAAAAWQGHRLDLERRSHAETRMEHAEHITGLERAASAAEAAARAEEQRRAQALQEVIDETEQKLARARSDADAATDAGQRLRAQLSATLAGRSRGASGHPGAAGAGPATDTTISLLADMQRRLDEASDGIARHADEARAAGAACELSYRALTAAAALDR